MRIAFLFAASLALLATTSARAAHPLQTEDTGTQGTRNLELENGFSSTTSAGARQIVYQPQLSVGVLPELDAIVQPSWLRSRDAGGTSVEGFGDTNVDAKWRFYGRAPWSFGVRAGATFATAERGLGMRHGDVSPHAIMVATYELAPVAVHANVGAARNAGIDADERRTVLRASTAVMWSVDSRTILTLDGGTSSNPDARRSSWVSTLLAGAIYTLHPSLDVDVGYQSTVGGTPSARQWLVGLTYRFGF